MVLIADTAVQPLTIRAPQIFVWDTPSWAVWCSVPAASTISVREPEAAGRWLQRLPTLGKKRVNRGDQWMPAGSYSNSRGTVAGAGTGDVHSLNREAAGGDDRLPKRRHIWQYGPLNSYSGNQPRPRREEIQRFSDV